jgi:hypothetical protein
MRQLRNAIVSNLSEGFAEVMNYGMLCYVVPHDRYPQGYHCDPKQPLPFLSVASQKNGISVYHMGIYADQKLLDWFVAEFPSTATVNWTWERAASASKSQNSFRSTYWDNCSHA